MADDDQDQKQQDTSEDTQDQTGDDQGTLNEGNVDSDDGLKFSKAQLQQVSSIMGNIIKKNIDETVMPLINKPAVIDTTDKNNPVVTKFNEELQEMIYQGDVVGAFRKFNSVQQTADKNLSSQQATQLKTELSGFEEKPYYKDISSEVESHASELSKDGYPAKPAAELAYQTVLNNHLMTNREAGGNLNMTTGGRRTVQEKGATLPKQFEAAYQRDKAKGLFKDRDDYLSSLSPQVRKQYEI